MTNWPVSLPQCFLPNGYSEEGADNLISSSNEIGPDKVRRRSTSAPYRITGVLKCSATQKIIFRDFFHNDIKSGSKTFYFPNSEGGDPLLVRIIPPYNLSRVGVSWRVKIDLEVLP